MGKVKEYHSRERETERIRVIVHGAGVMGSLGVKMMAAKRSLKIVGAVARRKEKAGKDLGEVVGLGRELGVIVSNDADAVFSESVADVVLDTTCSHTREIYPVLAKALKAKLNFISIAEEMAYPWVNEPELALSIDKLARKNGVTVLGTGLNPGFALDAVPILFTGLSGNLTKVRARRLSDLSSFYKSSTILKHFGVGLTPEEYERQVQEGIVVGHVGLPEVVAIIADTLGWEVKITETKEPLIAKVRRDISGYIIEPGQVYGTRQVGRGLKDGEEVIVMEVLIGYGFDLETEGLKPGMRYWLEGEPYIEVDIVSGVTKAQDLSIATMARSINAIPYVVNARPGMLSIADMGLISYLS